VESPRPYGSRSRRDALADSLPALSFFVGAVIAITIGIIDPQKLFSVGGTILLVSAGIGFLGRLLVPRDEVEGAASRKSRGFDLVIFDCDGVLVDSEVLTVGVEARVLSELGWPMDAPEVVRRWVGRPSASQLAEIAERLGPEAAERFDELTTREVTKEFERSLLPVDGVRRLLDHLDDIELDYCVASSGSQDKMRLTLGITGLMGRFAGRIYSTDEVANGKPEPDLFFYAAHRMGASPARCAVVEDSGYGVQAAVAAGMTAFGYAGGLTEARLLSGAGATVFHEMSDLVGLLSHSSANNA
jgi:HAD superfamily hydrolase (TIGR01509 family)